MNGVCKMQRLLRNQSIALLSLVLGIGLLPLGCSDDDADVTLKRGNPTGTITGKIIDGNTREPVGGAEVVLVVNDSKQTTVSSSSTDPDLTGRFALSNVPAGTHTLRISTNGFATVQFRVTVPQTFDNAPVTANVGTIGLARAFDLTVVVTANGAPIEGITVFAEPQLTSAECSKDFDSPIFGLVDDDPFEEETGVGVDAEFEITALTGADGTAVLSGLNECLGYFIVAPPFDSDGDGVPDFETTARAYEGRPSSEPTVSLALSPTGRDEPIEVIFATFDVNEEAGFEARNISDVGDLASPLIVGTVDPFRPSVISSVGSNKPITMVFNLPVRLDSGLTVSHRNELVDPDADSDLVVDPQFPETVVLGAAPTLDSTGTILTITPPEGGWPVNNVLTVNGVVSATHSGPLDFSFFDPIAFNQATFHELDMALYVADSTATGVGGDTFTLTADNYSGLPSSAFSAQLTGDQEVPPVDTNRTASGNFRLTDVTGDGLMDLTFTVTLNGLFQFGVNAVHLHNGPARENGPIVHTVCESDLGLPCFDLFDEDVTFSGTWSSEGAQPVPGRDVPLTDDLIAALQAGNIYIDVQTFGDPDADIRGQLLPGSTVFVEFPEFVVGVIRVISKENSQGNVSEINKQIALAPDDPRDPSSPSFDGEMVFTDASDCPSCGNGAGIFYRVSTGEVVDDGGKITLAVDVIDTEGNAFTADGLELEVQ
jgi:hypothetical protein